MPITTVHVTHLFCTPEQGLALEQLGIRSENSHLFHARSNPPQWRRINDGDGRPPAWTASELGVMLPAGLPSRSSVGVIWLEESWADARPEWPYCSQYIRRDGLQFPEAWGEEPLKAEARCEAFARAVLLLKLLRRKVIPAEWCNARISGEITSPLFDC